MPDPRDEILRNVRAALARDRGAPIAPIPATAKVGPRTPGDLAGETAMLLSEIEKLGGVGRQIGRDDELPGALQELVRAEGIRKATLWETNELREWGIAEMLRGAGVELVSPRADPRQIAECDLGVTGVDAALPETGTLLLRSSPERPRMVSLVPRVHLALLRTAALRTDLHQAFEEFKDEGYLILVSGPSRTADIELTVTIGVHGPKSLHVWLLEG